MAFGDLQGVFDVLFPATSQQGPANPVVSGFEKLFIGLKIAGARSVNHNPLGKFFSEVMLGQCGNQFAVPVRLVFAVEFCRTGAAKKYS